MLHSLLFCSRILVSRSYKYTCVGLVGGQRIVSPLLLCAFSLPSRESRPPSTVQATALLHRPGLELDIFLPSTDAAIIFLHSRSPPSRGRPARLASELLSNPCSDSDLHIRIQFYYPRTLWEREPIFSLSDGNVQRSSTTLTFINSVSVRPIGLNATPDSLLT
jgi:hypothetical protein